MCPASHGSPTLPRSRPPEDRRDHPQPHAARGRAARGAADRAALRRRARPDRPADGPAFRAVSTVTFTALAAGASFVDCAAEVVAATLDGAPLRPAGRRAARAGPAAGRARAAGGVGPGPHHRRARASTGRSTRPTARSTCGPRSSRTRRATPGPASTSPTSRRRTPSPSPPRPRGPCSATAAPRRSTRPAAPAPGRSPTPRRSRRTTRSSTPARSSSCGAAPAASTSGCYARRSLAAVLERDADEVFRVTGQGLAFFGGVFRMPFPQERYDQVFLPEFGGAMENYGCVSWSDDFLQRSAPTPAETELLVRILLHEMAHMWFGNIVTMRWWDDLWLNEAFAEFACHWAAERATSYTDVWATHLAGEELKAYLADQGPATHPIRQPILDVAAGRLDLRRHHLPQGRLRPAAADDLRRRGGVLRRHGRLLRPPRLGQHDAAGPRRRAGAGERARPGRLARGLAGAGRDRPARPRAVARRPGAGRAGPQGAPRARTCSPSAPTTVGEGLVRTVGRPVEVQGPRTPVDLPARRPLPRQRRRPHLRHRPAVLAAATSSRSPRRCRRRCRAASPSPPSGTCS